MPPVDSVTSFAIWALMGTVSLLGGGLLYFVIRYINKSDEGLSSLKQHFNTKIESLETTVSNHSTEMEAIAKKMGHSEVEIGKKANQMREDALKFRSSINEDLIKIHQKATEVSSTLNKAVEDIENLSGTVQNINKTVGAHHQSLSTGARAIDKLRKQVGAIETTLTKIGKNSVLVGQKSQKDD